jgi:glyoxylase-like metal-dependent hydrolase (beta-lactamase superfamily II)
VTHSPRLIADGVYFCGFASPKSYRARNCLIVRPGGNWMTDAPRFAPELAEGIEKLGGLSRIFLTHRDDLADADLYAKPFGAQRIIRVPGHTRGHCVLLDKDKFLFTGDHLEGDQATGRLDAFRDFCWYDWAEQTNSMTRLQVFQFEWVLPGHGGQIHLPSEKMQEALAALIERMFVPETGV